MTDTTAAYRKLRSRPSAAALPRPSPPVAVSARSTCVLRDIDPSPPLKKATLCKGFAGATEPEMTEPSRYLTITLERKLYRASVTSVECRVTGIQYNTRPAILKST